MATLVGMTAVGTTPDDGVGGNVDVATGTGVERAGVSGAAIVGLATARDVALAGTTLDGTGATVAGGGLCLVEG